MLSLLRLRGGGERVMDVASKGVILKCVRQEKYLKERIWCIREDYSASPHPDGPLREQRYPPWSSRQSIAHQVTSSSLIPWRIMVHPGGFEPPTARFVAEYSIQLSYGCIGDIALLRFTSSLLIAWRIWCIREDYSASPHPDGPLLKQRYPPWNSR